MRCLNLIGMVALLLAGCSTGPAPRPQSMASPTQGDAQSEQAQALQWLSDGDSAAAEAALIALAQAHPYYSGPLTNLGILYARQGRADQAISALRRAVAINPDNVVAWNWLGSQLRAGGDFAEAEQAYLSALKAPGEDPASHQNLAVLYAHNLDRPADALSHFQSYQQLSEDDSLVLKAWMRGLQTRSAGRTNTEVAE